MQTRRVPLNDAYEIAKAKTLIWVNTVCPDLSVQKLRIIVVLTKRILHECHKPKCTEKFKNCSGHIVESLNNYL